MNRNQCERVQWKCSKAKMSSPPIRKILSLLLSFLLISHLGCGGGTRGTGIGDNVNPSQTQDSPKKLSGLVVDASGVGIPGVGVKIVELDNFVTTNENGEFNFFLNEIELREITLQISLADVELSGTVPATEEFISVQIDITSRVVVVLDEGGDFIGESQLKEL